MPAYRDVKKEERWVPELSRSSPLSGSAGGQETQHDSPRRVRKTVLQVVVAAYAQPIEGYEIGLVACLCGNTSLKLGSGGRKCSMQENCVG